jgi:predicted secreted Zn-dependent protease
MFISAGNQLMAKFRLVFCILCMTGFVAPAVAALQSTTTYNYFAIKGKTPREVYAALRAHAPTLGDTDAMASTAVNLAQHPVITERPSCRMKGFSVSLKFKINLPRLENAAALAPATRRSWANFAANLKTHEEYHRAIWITCAEGMTARVLRIQPSTCQKFKNSYAALSKAILAKCADENRLFDATERIRFMTLPFMRQVKSSSGIN